MISIKVLTAYIASAWLIFGVPLLSTTLSASVGYLLCLVKPHAVCLDFLTKMQELHSSPARRLMVSVLTWITYLVIPLTFLFLTIGMCSFSLFSLFFHLDEEMFYWRIRRSSPSKYRLSFYCHSPLTLQEP